MDEAPPSGADAPSPELSARAAERRDRAATRRDDAADARDVLAVSAGEVDQAASDRESAAHDRADAARDREAWALLASAGAARDAAAAARDAAAEAEDAQHAGDRRFAAADRAAAAKDRQQAAVDRHGAEDHLQQAYRDDLTGLLHRDAGRDQLDRALARARRLREPIVLAFLDVDRLKSVNDARGHAGGDDVLRAVGAALRDGLRSYDVVMRYGGDEFVCAFVGARAPDAEERIHAMEAAVTQAVADASFSFGLAELTDDASLDDLIGRADDDMYARRAARRC